VKRSCVLIVLVVLGLGASAALGQTTVQLPTYSFSTTSTTVSVPDRGQVFLGGVNRAADGRSEFGVPMLGKIPYAGRLFGNRAIGSERSAMNHSVKVRIHDFESMDPYLQGLRPGETTGPGPAAPARAAAVAPDPWAKRLAQSGESSAGQAVMSVAEAKRLAGAQQTDRNAKSLNYARRGWDAEQAGRPRVAVVYYQSALSDASGDLRTKILGRMAAIDNAKRASAIAQSGP